MVQWTVDYRVFAYDAYVKNSNSVTKTQRLFRRHFDIHRNQPVPNRNTLLRWVNSFKSKGNILKTKPPGPVRSVRTPQNIARVRMVVTRSPIRSARRQARELNMNRETVRRILLLDLKFHPYKMQVVQLLKATDYGQRVGFAVSMQALLRDNPNAILLMSDEAHFHLNGPVNKQNFRYWSPQNPHNIHEKLLHSPKVTVWCAVSRSEVIGPYFFLRKIVLLSR